MQQSGAPEDIKQARYNGLKKGLRKRGLEKYLTLAEANSTTNRTFEVKIAEMKS